MSANIRNSLVGIAIVIMIGALFVLINSDNDISPTEDSNKLTTLSDTQAIKDDTAQDTEVVEGTDVLEEIPDSQPGRYIDYSGQSTFSNDTVLFFHAGWCPTCNILESDIEKNLSEIPTGIDIIKIDFDSEVDLRKKYKVNVQHTLISVDNNGDEITRIVGGNTLVDVIELL